MMAVLAAILPLASQGSTLALLLYRVAAANPHEARELLGTAKGISHLALIVKEVGTIIKEDDRLPSAEVCLLFMVLFAALGLTNGMGRLLRPSKMYWTKVLPFWMRSNLWYQFRTENMGTVELNSEMEVQPSCFPHSRWPDCTTSRLIWIL